MIVTALLLTLASAPTLAPTTTATVSQTVTATAGLTREQILDRIVHDPAKARKAIDERDRALTIAQALLDQSAVVPAPSARDYVRWVGVVTGLVGGGVLLGAKLSGNAPAPNKVARVSGVIGSIGTAAALISLAL